MYIYIVQMREISAYQKYRRIYGQTNNFLSLQVYIASRYRSHTSLHMLHSYGTAYQMQLTLSLSLIYSKFLLIIPSSTSQKFYPLFYFYSHNFIITYYSHIILFALLFQVLSFRETQTWYIFCYSYCVNNSDINYIHTVLPQFMARAFISFQQLFTLATK